MSAKPRQARPKERELELVARCAGGFEDVLARELRALGIRRVRPLSGSVAFFATQRDLYRACLQSRVATRVQLVLTRIPASDASELYQGVVSFPWERYVADGSTIAVRAHGTNTQLRNSQFTALKVKDGLCDRLRETRGARPDVDAKHPDFSVDAAIHDTRATLCLNLSGESLHRRGYRQEGVQTEAPLKETLAAGILLAAGWDRVAAQGGTLVDPMCGSGTFAIEGALIAAGIAPGLFRERWGFMGWTRHRPELWQEVLEQERGMEGASAAVTILAGDLNSEAVEIAKANAERAGVSGLVRFYVDDAANLSRRLRGVPLERGLLVANPPYGLRLMSQSELVGVHRALAAATDALPSGWNAALITPDLGVDTALGRVPEQLIACHNGPIEAWARFFHLSDRPLTQGVVSLAGKQREVRVADAASAQFAGRLRKVAKERLRWARREGVESFRVYDADLPDFPYSVDVYEGEEPGDRAIVVQEHPRPRSVDVQRAGRHFYDAVELAAALLDAAAGRVVPKPWLDDALFRRVRDREEARTVRMREGGLFFDVDALDDSGVGLAFELRLVRGWIGERASGARFANLFAAGGAATAFAALGGASKTVTVDSSKERLDWVARALGENGLAGRRHSFACEDVRAWLARETKARRSYDLVLCTPPERLAARKGAGEWSLERDLPELLNGLARVLAKGGAAVLVLPAEGPEPKTSLEAEEITVSVVPHDLERSRDHPRVFVLG